MVNLLPCPFCGGTSVEADYNEFEDFCVVCTNSDCLASGPLVDLGPIKAQDHALRDAARAKAVELWNRRATIHWTCNIDEHQHLTKDSAQRCLDKTRRSAEHAKHKDDNLRLSIQMARDVANGLTYVEIGAKYGITTSRVHQRVSKVARACSGQILRKQLGNAMQRNFDLSYTEWLRKDKEGWILLLDKYEKIATEQPP